jgi:hypothetical protein
MALDLRTAIGWLLLAIGLQLAGYGLFSDGRAASMNIQWGGIIAAAGAAFHLLVRLGKKA